MNKTILAWTNAPSDPELIRLRHLGHTWEIAPAAPDDASAPGTRVAVMPANDLVFYRLTLPPAKPDQLARMVQLQVEAAAPLPMNQLTLAWQQRAESHNRLDILAAVIRTHAIRHSPQSPDFIIPAPQGLAAAARRLCDSDQPDCLILHLGPNESQACLVRDHTLQYAAPLDVTAPELFHDDRLAPQPAQRLAQDLARILADAPADLREILLLTPDPDAFAPLAHFLRARGHVVHQAAPQPTKLTAQPPQSPAWLYDRLPLLGAAIAAAEDPARTLNLASPATDARPERPSRKLPPWPISAALAAIMLVAFIAAGYARDRQRLHHARSAVAALENDDARNLRQRENLLRQAAAKRRTDPLATIDLVASAAPENVMLDKIHLGPKNEISLAGSAPDEQAFYAFQEALQAKPAVTRLRGAMESFDEKTKKWKFTITFIQNHQPTRLPQKN